MANQKKGGGGRLSSSDTSFKLCSRGWGGHGADVKTCHEAEWQPAQSVSREQIHQGFGLCRRRAVLRSAGYTRSDAHTVTNAAAAAPRAALRAAVPEQKVRPVRSPFPWQACEE